MQKCNKMSDFFLGMGEGRGIPLGKSEENGAYYVGIIGYRVSYRPYLRNFRFLSYRYRDTIFEENIGIGNSVLLKGIDLGSEFDMYSSQYLPCKELFVLQNFKAWQC